MRLSPRISYHISIFIALLLIGGAITAVKHTAKAAAVTIAPIPFAGEISMVELCCNGIEFRLTEQYNTVARGSFIMEWPKMIPNPYLGFGLYSWWALLPKEKVLGSAIPGGQCITIASECESSEKVDFSVNQVGTTLLSAVKE